MRATFGFGYLWHPTEDDGAVKPPGWFAKAITFALPAICQYRLINESRARGIIYFHCAAGFNRGPSLCYAFMRVLGYSALDAEGQIRSRRQVGLRYKGDAETALKALGWI
jgi:hypothetical protein